MKKILIIILLSTLGAFAQSSTVLLLFDDFEPETQLYLSSLTTPLSYDQQVRLNTFVKMVKDSLQISSLSSKFDVMYLLANETSEAGLKNLVKRSHDATAVNSPTFTQWEGFTGNGTSSYINTNYNDYVNGVVVQATNFSLGAYDRIGATITNRVLIGKEVGGVFGFGQFIISPYSGDLTARIKYNEDYVVSTEAIPFTNGMKIIRRIDNSSDFFVNNVTYNSRTNVSSSLVDSNLGLLAFGHGGLFSNAQISFAFVGSYLTATEVSKLTNCVEWYMDSLNRGVIP